MLCHLTEKSKNIVKPKPSPITDREIDGLQYLSGYVIHKLLKKTKAKCNYNSVDNQAVRERRKTYFVSTSGFSPLRGEGV